MHAYQCFPNSAGNQNCFDQPPAIKYCTQLLKVIKINICLIVFILNPILCLCPVLRSYTKNDAITMNTCNSIPKPWSVSAQSNQLSVVPCSPCTRCSDYYTFEDYINDWVSRLGVPAKSLFENKEKKIYKEKYLITFDMWAKLCLATIKKYVLDITGNCRDFRPSLIFSIPIIKNFVNDFNILSSEKMHIVKLLLTTIGVNRFHKLVVGQGFFDEISEILIRERSDDKNVKIRYSNFELGIIYFSFLLLSILFITVHRCRNACINTQNASMRTVSNTTIVTYKLLFNSYCRVENISTTETAMDVNLIEENHHQHEVGSKWSPLFEDGPGPVNVTARIGTTVQLNCKIQLLYDKTVKICIRDFEKITHNLMFVLSWEFMRKIENVYSTIVSCRYRVFPDAMEVE
ncbi:hypothetical protein QTP88_005447 [Uroleucon formosanum]